MESGVDLIIKYSGNLEAVREIASSVTELSNVVCNSDWPESRIEQLAQIPEIEYIEKPKRLFFERRTEREFPAFFRYKQHP